MSNTFDNNQQLQILRINDFSAGIVQFSRFNYGPIFSPSAPLGSAAIAFRCQNLPGIGLIPFPKVTAGATINTNRSLDGGTTVYCTGFLAYGPYITSITQAGAQGTTTPDVLYISFDYVSGGNRIREVTAYKQPTATAQNLISLNTLSPIGYRYCPNFVTSRITQNGASTVSPRPVVSWCEMDYSTIYFSPDVTNVALSPLGNVATALIPIHMLAHASRLAFLSRLVINEGWTGNCSLDTDEDMQMTDPPQGFVFSTGVPNTFNPESLVGFGAWGSINSGELMLVKRAGGGVIISGDLLAPTGVTKLPGVASTGKVMQHAANTPAGLLYVTETDGVYSWNGSNTSQKISQQIPDDACRRKELPDTTTVGNLSTHDVMNGLCFFANNWTFDTDAGAWWLCEDPSVVNLSLFSRSSMGRYMYGILGFNTFASLTYYTIDFETPASSWIWVSNPIPVVPGALAEVDYVEILASNPSVNPTTITITPTPSVGGPGAVTRIVGNNPQTVTFTIPAGASAMRVGQRLGYRDYNLQIQIVATNSFSNSAPILHEVSLGYRPGSGLGINQ